MLNFYFSLVLLFFFIGLVDVPFGPTSTSSWRHVYVGVRIVFYGIQIIFFIHFEKSEVWVVVMLPFLLPFVVDASILFALVAVAPMVRLLLYFYL